MSDVVFVSDACPSCHVVTSALAARPVAGVTVANIDRDPAGRLAFESAGTRAVPTAVIGGRPVVGAYAILQALRAKYGAP